MKTMIRHSEAAETNATSLNDLKKLVRQGESEFLEFKRKVSFPEKVVCEMLAFANTHGGTLLIGVSDDGGIPGVKHPDEEIFVLENALSTTVRPSIKTRRSVIEIEPHRFVVRYDVSESKRKPHYFLGPDRKREVYIRHADKTIQASNEMKEILRRSNNKRNIQFRYNDQVAMLMQFLHSHPTISLEQYQHLTGMNRYRASRSLVLLVLANVLHVIPSDRGDRYAVKPI